MNKIETDYTRGLLPAPQAVLPSSRRRAIKPFRRVAEDVDPYDENDVAFGK